MVLYPPEKQTYLTNEFDLSRIPRQQGLNKVLGLCFCQCYVRKWHASSFTVIYAS